MTTNENTSSELNPSTPNQRDKKRRKRHIRIINACSLIIFFALAFFAYTIPYFNWDLAITHSLQSIKILRPFMSFISLFGNGFIPHIITAITALIFIIFRLRYEAIGIVFSAGIGALINFLIKLLIRRPRPTDDIISILQEPGGLSFPSGHVAFYVCYFGFLFFLVYRNMERTSLIRIPLLILLALPILLIGFSRIYLGVHWASDTLGAYLWSSVWLTISLSLYQRWIIKNSPKPQV